MPGAGGAPEPLGASPECAAQNNKAYLFGASVESGALCCWQVEAENAYERQRREQIARNQARMLTLQLPALAAEMKPAAKSAFKPRGISAKKRSLVNSVSNRARHHLFNVVIYTAVKIYIIMSRHEPKPEKILHM